MNTLDLNDTAVFSIEELEARFEMEAVPLAPVAGGYALDWKCGCTLEF